MEEKPKLIDEIIASHFDAELVTKYSKMNTLLGSEPRKEWVREHPFAKGVRYIPIERIEMMLRQLYGVFEVTVRDFKVIANSVAVHITLTITDPISGQKISQDGLGAMPIQLDKDSNPTDFSKIKPNAIMLALPSAESYALKDAAEKLGKIFGADLNRKEKVYYQHIYPDLYDKGGAYQAYIERLVETSSLDTNEREVAKDLIYAPETSIAELENLKDKLKKIQLDPITHGDGYNQTDIGNHLKKLQ